MRQFVQWQPDSQPERKPTGETVITLGDYSPGRVGGDYIIDSVDLERRKTAIDWLKRNPRHPQGYNALEC